MDCNFIIRFFIIIFLISMIVIMLYKINNYKKNLDYSSNSCLLNNEWDIEYEIRKFTQKQDSLIKK